jgi:pimeloyl-ACP methyl ester carboxylesterase
LTAADDSLEPGLDRRPTRWRRTKASASGLVAMVAFVTLGAAAGCSSDDGDRSGAGTTPTTEATTRAGAEGGRSVDIGDGRTLWLDCRGRGSPTVVLESGYHDSSDLWVLTDATAPAVALPVMDLVSARYRVCAYDRPGTLRYTTPESEVTDRSSPVPMPRTAAAVVDDLHLLLETAGERGPFLLVSHSLGGLFSRLYAQTHPSDVAGVVFVDAFPIEIPMLFGDRWPAYRAVLDGAGSNDDPAFEQIDIDASIAEVRSTGSFPDVPIAVISKTEPFAGLPASPEGFTQEDLERNWLAGEVALVALRPQTPHVLATGSDHYVQVHQPDLVVAVVDLVRDRASATPGG